MKRRTLMFLRESQRFSKRNGVVLLASTSLLLLSVFIHTFHDQVFAAVRGSLAGTSPLPVNPEAKESLVASKPSELSFQHLTLTNLDGVAVTLEGFKDRPVLVYFWSLYCHGCSEPLKALEELKTKFNAEGTEVLTVHLFGNPGASDFKSAVEKRSGLLPVYTASAGIRDLFEIRSLPQALLFDKQHRLVKRIDGPLTGEAVKAQLLLK